MNALTYPLFSAWHSLKNSRPILFLSQWVRYLFSPSYQEGIFIESVIFRPIALLRHTNKCDHHFLYEDDVPSWSEIHNDLKKTKYNGVKAGDAIDIYYRVNRQTIHGSTSTPYIASYTYPFPISFPPYTLEEIKEYPGNNPKVVMGCSVDKRDERIPENNNYTEILQLYAGPKHNFYADLPFRRGLHIWRELLLPPQETVELHIINSHGGSFSFHPRDRIDWTPTGIQESILPEEKEEDLQSEVRRETLACTESEGPSVEV